MQECKKFQERIYLYYFDELSEQEKAEFDRHAAQCKDCARRLQRAKGIIDLANRKTAPEQPMEFWSNYNRGLREKLKELRPFPVFELRLVPRLAAVAIVLIIGILVVIRSQMPARQEMVSRTVEEDVVKELENDLVLQELALLEELGEDVEFPLSDEDLVENMEMLEELNAT